jgi:hypothetical protein
MSKLEEQQIEALNKINQLREIRFDVILNGIHNPYSTQLIELRELELKEQIESDLKSSFLVLIEEKLSELTESTTNLLDEDNQ